MTLTRIRLRDDEGGYALVITMLLVFIMMILMVVSLNTGQSALRQSQEGIRWTKTLTLAEAGVNDAITRIAQAPIRSAAVSACALDSGTACPAEGGEYQVSWTMQADGSIVVDARGYYPTLADARYDRQVRVVLEPAPTFQYALFSLDAIYVKNNAAVVGDVYSAASVTVDNVQTICGSVIAAGGDVTLGNNTQIVKSYAPSACVDKSGKVWASGSIRGAGITTVIQGDAQVAPPDTCDLLSQVTNVTVGGTKRCSTPPAVEPLPTFVFDPNNYPAGTLSCYPAGGTCGPSNPSATSVATFNTYVQAFKSSLAGTHAIWQTNPSQLTRVNLESIKLGGDLTVITNAPIDFGNTDTITTAPGVTSAELVVISLYVPPVNTTCDANGGDCSIYSQNRLVFDSGVPSDPNDGIAGLVYTPGKMAVKNADSAAEGALYSGSMDIKNGFAITYNPRIERILGFGTALEQALWQELNV